MTYAKINVWGKDGSPEVQMLVDAGSTFTWLSSDELKKLGVEPMGIRRLGPSRVGRWSARWVKPS